MRQGNSPTVTFRIAPLLLEAVKSEIERYNRNPLNEPMDMTRFIAFAISERLSKVARSNTKRPKKRVVLQAKRDNPKDS